MLICMVINMQMLNEILQFTCFKKSQTISKCMKYTFARLSPFIIIRILKFTKKKKILKNRERRERNIFNSPDTCNFFMNVKSKRI